MSKQTGLSQSGLTSLFRPSSVLRFALSVLLPFYRRLFAAARRDRSDYHAVTFRVERYSWSIVVTGSSSSRLAFETLMYDQWLFFNIMYHPFVKRFTKFCVCFVSNYNISSILKSPNHFRLNSIQLI